MQVVSPQPTTALWIPNSPNLKRPKWLGSTKAGQTKDLALRTGCTTWYPTLPPALLSVFEAAESWCL